MSANMSACFSFAATTATLPAVAIINSAPCTVLTLPGPISLAKKLPHDNGKRQHRGTVIFRDLGEYVVNGWEDSQWSPWHFNVR